MQCIFKKYIHCKYSNRKENSLFLRQQLGNFSVRSLIVVFSKFYSCTCLPNTVLCEQISDSLWIVVKTDNCLILFDNHVQMLCIRVSIYDVFLWVDTTPFILSCYLLNFLFYRLTHTNTQRESSCLIKFPEEAKEDRILIK